MKKISIFLLTISVLFTTHSNSVAQSTEIKWMSLSEVETAMKKKPKKIFVDVYTDWCGWCKRLDATTYKDAAVVKYINENFYSVKLDAEMKQPVTYQGKIYTYEASMKKNSIANEFMGASGSQCKQVGNAFPPMAAEIIANTIAKAITNNWVEDGTSNLAYYSLLDNKG